MNTDCCNSEVSALLCIEKGQSMLICTMYPSSVSEMDGYSPKLLLSCFIRSTFQLQFE